MKENLVKLHPLHEQDSSWKWYAYSVNKKKFRRAIRRLVSKCLISPRKEQIRQTDEMNEAMADDYCYTRSLDDEEEERQEVEEMYY